MMFWLVLWACGTDNTMTVSPGPDDPDCPCTPSVKVLSAGNPYAGCRPDQTLTVEPLSAALPLLENLTQSMGDLDAKDLPVAIARCTCEGTTWEDDPTTEEMLEQR